MKATLYKELSNKQTPLELQAGLTVQEALPCFDLDNAIIVINGRIENYNYILQEKDKVTIRLIPGALTTGAIIAIAVISAVLVSNELHQYKRQEGRGGANHLTWKQLNELIDEITDDR